MDFIEKKDYHEWNKSIENILAGIGEKSNAMSKLSRMASRYYDNQRSCLLLPASIISWSLNIFSMISGYLGPEIISEPLVILIVSIGNFVSATLTTVAEKSKAGDKVELFNQSSKDYYLLYSEISTQLSFEPKLRIPPHELLKRSRDRYNILLQSNPNIPDSVVMGFWNNFKNIDITFPDHILHLQSVKIYQEPSEDIEIQSLILEKPLQNQSKKKKLIIKNNEKSINSTENLNTDIEINIDDK